MPVGFRFSCFILRVKFRSCRSGVFLFSVVAFGGAHPVQCMCQGVFSRNGFGTLRGAIQSHHFSCDGPRLFRVFPFLLHASSLLSVDNVS